MPRQKLEITSINGGFAPTQDFGGDGTYQFGLGIDPDYSLRSTLYRKSAALVPVRYETFSTAAITGAPNWIITNPKNTNIYVYTKDPTGSAPELSTLALASDPNLQAYYKFSAGALTTDSSGKSKTLTNNNTVAENVNGKFNGCADFGSVDADKSLSIADSLGYAGDAYSVSMWIKLNTEIASGSYRFFDVAETTKKSGILVEYEYNSGTRRLLFDRMTINLVNYPFYYNITLGTADWYHIAFTYDGTTLKGYVNGVQVGSRAVSGNGTGTVTASTKLGGAISSNNALCLMDDVAMFNRMLSPEEVAVIYSNGGKFFSYSNALGVETMLSAVANGTGNGMAYYNNYIYLATINNVARYGPLDNTPAYTASFWVTTLSKTALNNKIYPSIQENAIPNHPMHVHGDNALYFGDTLNGQGIIHKIKTKKTTYEGDTDDGSTYNALDLPFGFFPTDIESWGTDLVICAIQTTDSSANQGRAALFLWDTVSDTFYAGPVWISDPLATAVLNVNGQIIIWSGSAQEGCRVSKYLGGVQISEMLLLEEACPPFAGAVISDGSRTYWGGFTIHPVTSACVYSYGSKDARLTQGLHIPIKTASVGATPNVTALMLYSQIGLARPKLVVGWKDAATQGIDKVSTSATYGAKFRSQPFNIGQKFRIAKLRLPLGATLAADMQVTPTIYFDDENDSMVLTTITAANFPNSQRKILYKDTQLESKKGENNFFLELAWTGTVELPIKFPIEIEIETYDNEQTT